MGISDRLKKLPAKGGSADAEASTFYTTPWAWKDTDGVYVGWNKAVWIYAELPLQPLTWEDPSRQLSVGGQLATVLYELADTTRDNAGGLAALASKREIHLVSVNWDTASVVPDGTPEALSEYLRDALPYNVPAKTLVIGVKLRSSVSEQLLRQAGSARGVKGLAGQLKGALTAGLGEDVPDLEPFQRDRELVEQIFARNGLRPLAGEPSEQLESWYNLGLGPDVTVYETKDFLQVSDGDRIEIAALQEFANPTMRSPGSMWALDAATAADAPAHLISVRATIEPPSVARSRARTTQRRVIAQAEEEASSGDLDRIENRQVLDLAREVERLFAGGEPLLANCSILFARRVTGDADSYIDELRNRYGIKVRPLEHRQLAALDETLPCSSKRVNPFLQDVTVPLLAYAGLAGFANLGDGHGVFVGLTSPDGAPCFLNPLGAPAADLPPGMLIAGDPGSGKTFLCQAIATQSTLGGLQTFFINPKYAGSLAPFAELVGGQVVRLSDIQDKEGFFDPFRFAATPTEAAKIATDFILDVLGSRGAGTGISQTQEIRLGAGLVRGAEAGARCVGEALAYVDDESVVELVWEQAKADTTFRLGISRVPQEPWHTRKGLTLIEFDKPLDFPEKGLSPAEYSRAQRIAIAAVRLVTRACIEVLASTRGGVLVLDEAWTFLSSAEGLAVVQRLGRLGRSQNILPIFATQRIDDLLRPGVDMEGYLSRVFVLKLKDEREIRAALQLCGLEPTKQRIEWLREAGPRRASDGMPARAAYALHRDLKSRHAAVMLGPIPPAAMRAWSTNPEDQARREAEEQTNRTEE